MSFSPEEISYLADHADGIAQLDLPRRLTIADVEKLRSSYGHYGRAVAELIQARHSVSGKLPESWLLCFESAQQSTPGAVSRIRAQRIEQALGQSAEIYDVTCSIGSEAPAIAATGMKYVGSDIDYSRLLMARYNLESLGQQPRLIQADALKPAVTGVDAIIADPARRSDGRRITDPAKLLPPLPELIETWAGTPMAIKCAPGIDFSHWDGLVSIVSVDKGVKEACLYTKELADGQRREAVVIRGGTVDRITDATDSAPDSDLAGPPGRYIIDPDGAIVRAGLVRHYAIRENLWMLDERIAYLTGDRIPAGTTGFRFVESVPIKKLKNALKSHNAGSVEILVRGVDIDPDKLRKKLSLRGEVPMAVIITRIGRTGVALICQEREKAA